MPKYTMRSLALTDEEEKKLKGLLKKRKIGLKQLIKEIIGK